MKNIRSGVELNIKDYAKVLRAEVEFDIPKSRNCRRLSAFGYEKSPHDSTYFDGCDDEKMEFQLFTLTPKHCIWQRQNNQNPKIN